MFHRRISVRLSTENFVNDLLVCLRTDTLATLSIKASKTRPGRHGTHVVEPYTVVVNEEAISLLVLNRGTDQIELYDFDVIQRVMVMKEGFDFPMNFEPKSHLD